MTNTNTARKGNRYRVTMAGRAPVYVTATTATQAGREARTVFPGHAVVSVERVR